jgi:uncharacterized protein YhaN
MNLLRCHILGFGKLANQTLSFTRGMNVVFAANEGGKSTLQRFLMALLYGQLRSDLKAQRRMESWVDQFRPWRGTEYGGTLWCALAGGRELEIHRTFGREEARMEIRTAGGEEITREYETQRNGDVVFAAAHLGLAKELFESIAVVRESETAALAHREPLRDRIANLAQAGDEKLSVRLSLVKLEEALETIGSDRAPTRPYKQALDRFLELEQERKELEEQRSQCSMWVHETQELRREIERLEHDLSTAARGVVDARWREARLKVQNLEEADRDLGAIRAEVEALQADPDFPTHRLDDLNRFSTERENLERSMAEIRRQIQKADLQHDVGEEELGKLAAYASLQESVEPERITEWFVNYLSLSRQKDEAQRSMNRLTEELSLLQGGIDALCPALRDTRVDWEKKARLAAEEERTVSQQNLAMAEKIAKGKADHTRLSGKATGRGIIAGMALLAFVASAAAVIAGTLPQALGFSIAAILGVAGAIFLRMALHLKAEAQQAKRAWEATEAGLDRVREQAQSAQSELDEAVSESGLASAEEFLAAARQAALDRQRYDDLKQRLVEAGRKHTQLQLETDSVYTQLKECLNHVGLNCAPGNVKNPVDTLRTNMRRCVEFQAAQRRLEAQIETWRTDEDGVAVQLRANEARIQEILGEGKVTTTEAFRKACRNSDRLRELQAREKSRTREFERMCDHLTLDQWRARLEELEGMRGEDKEDRPAGEEVSSKLPCLPYLPTVEEAEQGEKRTAAILAGRREEHARLEERVRQAFQYFRSPAEVEEDLAAARITVDELVLNRKALTLALEGIRSLARLQQEVCAPQLNRMAEERFLQICPGRYEEVKVDPDFRVQVREQGTPELRAAESLSRGTQDQLYFALRFGVLELLGNEQEPCPCLLDEPFVAYDHERMCAAFRILEQESARRQLFLFTCCEDVRDQALALGAHLVTLS